jgi:hypothetical protein
LGHYLGGVVLSLATLALYGRYLTDTVTGYKLYAAPLVKSFRLTSTGFELDQRDHREHAAPRRGHLQGPGELRATLVGGRSEDPRARWIRCVVDTAAVSHIAPLTEVRRPLAGNTFVPPRE